jgi:DNA-binding CsgD family transcriptional regulator
LIRVRLDLPSPALREGVRALLEDDPQLEVAGRGSTSDAYDVVITTRGTKAADRAFQVDGALTGTLVLQDEPIDRGTWSLLPKPPAVLPLDASAEELSSAIRALAAGLLVASASMLADRDDEPRPDRPLTDREVEVLGLLAQGLANKQIALQLGISEHTVKFHISSIYAKLNAANRTQAVREGLRNGWVVL